MHRSLLDILACPLDKHYPLELLDEISDGDRIKSGKLHCSKCGRYFPIVDEIAIMLPDELRKNLSF